MFKCHDTKTKALKPYLFIWEVEFVHNYGIYVIIWQQIVYKKYFGWMYIFILINN